MPVYYNYVQGPVVIENGFIHIYTESGYYGKANTMKIGDRVEIKDSHLREVMAFSGSEGTITDILPDGSILLMWDNKIPSGDAGISPNELTLIGESPFSSEEFSIICQKLHPDLCLGWHGVPCGVLERFHGSPAQGGSRNHQFHKRQT